MEDVTGLALEPADLVPTAIPGNQSKSSWNIEMKSQHPQMMALEHLRVMKKRQIVKNGVVGREANVVG
ncbi:MAG: Uncharacterised protein [Halieaceae bacterium]|nr:MAG: Uncharacterised protein [Halieaceae bacterium]